MYATHNLKSIKARVWPELSPCSCIYGLSTYPAVRPIRPVSQLPNQTNPPSLCTQNFFLSCGILNLARLCSVHSDLSTLRVEREGHSSSEMSSWCVAKTQICFRWNNKCCVLSIYLSLRSVVNALKRDRLHSTINGRLTKQFNIARSLFFFVVNTNNNN